MPIGPAQFSASQTLQADYIHASRKEAGCRATLALVVVPQCVQLVVVVPILSSSLAAQLTFRLQPRLHLDELLFIEKELQQLVQEQTTATCRSVEATLTALHVVIIRARTPMTDAGACCPRRVRQPRALHGAVDVDRRRSSALQSDNECLTRRRVDFCCQQVDLLSCR